MPERPEIVCLCGSVRFAEELHEANRDLTLAGVIVVAPATMPATVSAAGPATMPDAEDSPAGTAGAVVTAEQRAALGALHLRKIDLADRVLVVNPGGYVGESTQREIAYARATGKPVSFTGPG